MANGDYLIMMGAGGVFLLLGLAALLWGRHEEKSYYDTISTRIGDLREFISHWPPRPQPGALKTGGWITIIIGTLVLVVGTILWLLTLDF